MIEALQYRIKLMRLRHQRRQTQRFYEKAIQEARSKKKPRDDIEALMYESFNEQQLLEAELYSLLTQRLIKTAEYNLLPWPEFDSNKWVKSELTGQRYLSLDALNELRMSIRNEKRARSESWRLWIAAWTGLVGTLIGLASIFLKR